GHSEHRHSGCIEPWRHTAPSHPAASYPAARQRLFRQSELAVVTPATARKTSDFCVQGSAIVLERAAPKSRHRIGSETMNTKYLFLMAVALSLAGCATGPKSDVYSTRSDLGGPGIDLIVDNELDSGDRPTELVWLN